MRRSQHRVLVAADRRHEAQEGQLEAPRHVFRRLDRVVHVVEAVRDADSQHQPDGERKQPGAPAGRCERAARHLRVIDDAHVVLPAVARHAQLFFARHQRLEDVAVGLRLALHHVVVDALLAQVLGIRLRGVEAARVRLLLELRGFVLVLDRGRCAVDGEVVLPLRFGDVGVHLLHVRVLFAVALGRPRAVGLRGRHLGLRRPHVRVLRDDRNGVEVLARRERAKLVVHRLLLRFPRSRQHDVVVQLVEPHEDDVLPFVERQRVLALAVVGERPLAFLGLLLLPFELFVEPVDHVLRRLLLQREVLLDVFVDERVGRELRELRIHRVERDVHELAARDRLDIDAPDECVHHRRLVRRLVDFRHLLRLRKR